jgi:hypothetical protein
MRTRDPADWWHAGFQAAVVAHEEEDKLGLLGSDEGDIVGQSKGLDDARDTIEDSDRSPRLHSCHLRHRLGWHHQPPVKPSDVQWCFAEHWS